MNYIDYHCSVDPFSNLLKMNLPIHHLKIGVTVTSHRCPSI